MSMDLDQVSLTGSMPVPRGWRSVTLHDIVSDDGVFVDGDWVESKDQDPAGDVRLIQLADVGDGEYRDRSERFLTSEKASDLGCTFLQPGDLLIARMPAPLGRACIFPGDRKRAVTVVDVAVVRPRNSEVNARWLMYCINAPQFRRVVASLQSGSTRQRISRKNLAKIVFPLPPLHWQDEVVAEIEKQFSRIDEGVANLRRVKASISRFRASVLAEAVGSADCTWPSRTIGTLLREPIVNGLSVKESLRPTAVRALRLSAMSDAGLHYEDHRFLPIQPAAVEDILVNEGDFFVSRGSGSLALVGRGATAQKPPFPVIFPDTMMRLRFADSDVRRWVAILWPSRFVRGQIEQRVKTTAGIYKIAQPQVASIRVPLPPAPERQRIATEVDRRLSIVREVEAEVDVNLAKAGALRRASLAFAFSMQEGGSQ